MPTGVRPLPERAVMLGAMRRKDPSFEGRFIVAVRTTGIFCRVTCRVRPPLDKNVEFFASPREAVLHGYRPCKRCKPLDQQRRAAPPVVTRMLAMIERAWPTPVRTRDLIEADIPAGSAQRAFQKHTGMSFASYQRSRRMGAGLAAIRKGTTMSTAQAAAGFTSSSGFRDALRRLLGNADARAGDRSVLTAAWIESPLGPMIAIASDIEGHEGLVTLDWIDRKGLERELLRVRRRLATLDPARSSTHPLAITAGEHRVLDQLRSELDECFTKRRTQFGVPLALGVGTAFQERVWGVLRGIPAGTTRSYSEQARVLSDAKAVRAVALANGANYRSIIIPCHRVVGADGSLTGYGGGLDRKRWLLEHEGGGLFA
jgi:AraC family transcriptional regulator of adaptative response/methylated-DNA-[protein]-cysteine methyltransferase